MLLENIQNTYQQYINSGYFEVKESVYKTLRGVRTRQTTYVIGKGQIFISNKIQKYYPSSKVG